MYRFKKSLLLATFFFSSHVFSLQADLQEKIAKIMHQPQYEHATWGLYAVDAKTGKVLYDLNSDQFFLPASTTKNFSVSALLNAYGDDYRFKTPVFALGKLENGKLEGVLVLVAQGDFTFGGRQSTPDTIAFTKMDHIIANNAPDVILTPQDPLYAIQDLAKQIKNKGIKEIVGDVLIDDRLFEIITKRDMVLSPMMINENLIDFTLNPSSVSQTAKLQVRPVVPGYSFENNVKTVAEGETVEPIAIKADESGKKITLTGNIALNQKNLVRTFSIQDPSAFARSALIDALENEGIVVHVTSEHKLPEKSEYKDPIAVFTSPPLSEYAKLILKVSHNLGADIIPLLLSAKVGKTDFEGGMKLFGDFVAEKVKISTDSFAFLDAAGGNDNRLTPKAQVKLLEYVRNLPKEQFQTFYNALPILGVDGSLEDFGVKTDAVNKARAKPGTGIMFNAATGELFLTTQAFSGFVEGKNGNLIEFTVVVNNRRMPAMDNIYSIFEDLSVITAAIYDASN